jgi:glycosyltransferase involved in cell wall biosynthesis
MPDLKIAQVSTTDMAMCVLLMDQIKSLQQQGHEVVAVCASGPWLESLRKEGIPVEVVEMERQLSPLRDLLSFCALVRCFRKHHFDVVHTHTPKAGLLGPIAAKVAGVPVVVHTIHGLLFHDRMPLWKRWFFWLPEKITAAFSDFILSQSKEDLAVATKSGLCSTAKIKYLGNGIDVAKFSPCHSNGSRHSTRMEMGISDTDIVIGSVGRLVYEKGFAELFAAAAELVERHKSWKFVIIGPREKGPRDAVPASEIEALSRSGSVFFLNWRDDVSRWYAAMDIFVLPSHREGVPRACMEAAAMELPVIATDIRGCREVVKCNETGILVPIKDSQALVAAIETLAQDEARRVELGKEGRLHILENFNHELVLERLRNFYAQIQLYPRMNNKSHEKPSQLRSGGIRVSPQLTDRLAEPDCALNSPPVLRRVLTNRTKE